MSTDCYVTNYWRLFLNQLNQMSKATKPRTYTGYRVPNYTKSVDELPTSKKETLKLVQKLEFQVRRRGATIAGLYSVINNLWCNPTWARRSILVEENADKVESLGKQLESARQTIKQLMKEKGVETHTEIPRGFGCNICFEDFSTDVKERSPLALQCGHTMCHGCLMEHTKKLKPGEKYNCPYCRKEIDSVIPLFV